MEVRTQTERELRHLMAALTAMSVQLIALAVEPPAPRRTRSWWPWRRSG
jgi:hypothetical protein